ncbi:hypothetical protein VCR14J2_260128 [Vibrio coralliirubri]|nr:hypothetical protein VCR14J2_260128 [Vibrio coralliirubri]
MRHLLEVIQSSIKEGLKYSRQGCDIACYISTNLIGMNRVRIVTRCSHR